MNLLHSTLGVALIAFSGVSGCVTVNVNFPESAAQRATDDYVKDLYRTRERRGAGNGSATSSSLGKTSRWLWLELVPEAHADSVDFKLKSATIDAIKETQSVRVDSLLEQKRAGLIGEAANGLVVLRNSENLKPLLRGRLEKLINEENSDRKKLYSEVLKLNQLPDARLKNIEETFSRSFQNESPSGTWIEGSDGKWSRKP
jgi:uncharacterized protein YdbL (DUF1318 family)